MKRVCTVVLTAVALTLIFALTASAQTVNCSGVAAWSGNSVSYTAGELVTYNGSEYQCLQSHTSEAGWDPPAVPALWSLVGACGSGGATPTPTPGQGATPTPTVAPTATPSGGGGGTCWAAWSSTAVYTGGAEVSYSGENYEAAYWTQGNNPSTSSGPAGSGQPWIPEGSCSGSGGGGATPTPTAKPTATSGGGGSSGLIFSPYKDVTVDANWNTGAQQSAVTGTSEVVTSAMPNSTLTWAFATGTCGSESWGGITPAQEATNVQAFVNAGKKYIVSTGGAAGSFDCPSGSAFLSFIQTYYSANMVGVDFDIEVGQDQAVVDDLINSAIAGEAQYPNMRFSFTIATFGGSANPILGSEGILVVDEIKRLGLGGNYTVNLMTMDYGSTTSNNCVVVNGACEMGQSAVQAAESLNAQYGIPYNHIEITPDIGENDTQGEVFTIADVDTVSSFIKSNGLAGAHFWSFDRDNPCAAGTDADNCNGNPSAGVLAYTDEYMSDLGVQ